MPEYREQHSGVLGALPPPGALVKQLPICSDVGDEDAIKVVAWVVYLGACSLCSAILGVGVVSTALWFLCCVAANPRWAQQPGLKSLDDVPREGQ